MRGNWRKMITLERGLPVGTAAFRRQPQRTKMSAVCRTRASAQAINRITSSHPRNLPATLAIAATSCLSSDASIHEQSSHGAASSPIHLLSESHFPNGHHRWFGLPLVCHLVCLLITYGPMHAPANRRYTHLARHVNQRQEVYAHWRVGVMN